MMRRLAWLQTPTVFWLGGGTIFLSYSTFMGLIIIIIFIYCNWVVTRWQWLFYIYTKHEIGCCDMKLVTAHEIGYCA